MENLGCWSHASFTHICSPTQTRRKNGEGVGADAGSQGYGKRTDFHIWPLGRNITPFQLWMGKERGGKSVDLNFQCLLFRLRRQDFYLCGQKDCYHVLRAGIEHISFSDVAIVYLLQNDFCPSNSCPFNQLTLVLFDVLKICLKCTLFCSCMVCFVLLVLIGIFTQLHAYPPPLQVARNSRGCC